MGKKTQELHEIVITADSKELKQADAEYKVFVEREKANDKIRVNSTKAADKIKVDSNKESGKLRLQDNNTLNKLLLESDKQKNRKELADYKNTQSEKIRIKRQAELDIQRQSKNDAKFTGQSVGLGSLAHIQGLSSTLKTMTPGTENYTKLKTQLDVLSASYKVAHGQNSVFNNGLLNTGKNLAVVGYAAYLAAQQFIAFGKSSVDAASEQELSIIQLKGAADDNTEQFSRMVDFATEMQNKWGIPDEQIESFVAYGLAQKTSETQIQKNIEAARIWALVNKVDITEAYKQVAASLEGNVKGFGKREADFKSLTKEQLENGAATDLIISKWSSLGNIQDSTYVKTQKLNAAWSETKETIGSVIVDTLSPLGDSLTAIGLKGQDVIKIVVKSAFGFGTITGVVKTVISTFKGLEVGTANVILGFTNMGSKLPVLGSFFSTLTGFAEGYKERLLEILGLQQNIGGGIPLDAKGGTRGGVVLKEPEAKGSNPTSNTSNKGGSTKEEKNAIDELIKSVNQELDIKRLLGKINLNLLTGQLDILKAADSENLKLEDRIKLLSEIEKLQARIKVWLTSGKSINEFSSKTIDTPNTNLPFRRGFKLKSSNSNDPRPDMTSDELQAAAEEMKRKEEARLGYVKEMWSSTQGMLSDFGLMKGTTAEIVNAFNSIISGLSNGFSFVKSLVGFIGGFAMGGPVGGAVGGVAAGTGGGGFGRFSSGINNIPINRLQAGSGSGNNIKVIIKNPVTLGKGMEVETRYNDVRGGIDL